MLQKVSKIPQRFYHLLLLNIGLFIAFSKGLSLIYIVCSLAFVIATVIPVAFYFKLLDGADIELIHVNVIERFKSFWGNSCVMLSEWQNSLLSNNYRYLVYMLLAIYCSINFVSPCFECFLLINAMFVFLFMQQQWQLLVDSKRAFCKTQ